VLFVFIFENADPVVDFATGMESQPSVAIESDTYEQAIGRLAVHCHANLDLSDDPTDYEDDIERGNLTVVLPAAV
jgi:hypothetical protein